MMVEKKEESPLESRCGSRGPSQETVANRKSRRKADASPCRYSW